MARFRIAALLVLFLNPAAFLIAQDKGFFRQIWLEEGLSQSSITSISQDQQGYIWFGTQDGLNRFDGKQIDQYNFQPFNPNSISGDQIQNLFPGKNNKFWILSTNGLDIMDLGTGLNRHLSKEASMLDSESSYKPVRIWVFNDLVFSYANGNLERIIEKNGKYSRQKYAHDKEFDIVRVSSMCLAPSGLYAGTNYGVFIVDTAAATFSRVPELDFSSFGLNMSWYKDWLFFTDKCELYMYNTKSGKIFKKVIDKSLDGLVTCTYIDNRNTLWIGTTGLGVYTFKIGNDELIADKHFVDNPGDRFSLKCNSISCFYQGKNSQEDILWIGTRDAGVVSYSYSRNAFDFRSSGLSKDVNFFGTVKDTQNIIYTATNNGLHILAPGKKPEFIKIQVENVFAQRPVEAILLDSKQRLWLGVGRHLYTLKNNNPIKVKEDIFHNMRTHILDIIEYEQDVLILATTSGMICYDINKNELQPYPFEFSNNEKSKEAVETVFKDSKNQFWIGSISGLYCFENRKEKHHFLNHAADRQSLLSNGIMDINETNDGEILVATTKGLSILVPEKSSYRIENYYKPDGLSNNFLYSLIPDKKGNFWISTNFGICRFDPVKRSFRSYHAVDGIFINEFNSGGAFASGDGELLFGGLGGLIGFYPEKIPASKIPPEVVLKSFIVNQSIVRSTNMNFGSLESDRNNIQLEFSVIDFSTDGRKKLIYRLNEDKEWMIVNGTNTISLANLAPGDYRLQVKAANRDGIESIKPLFLTFTIKPPFYQTWWFYSLIVVCAGIIAWMTYRIRLRQKIQVIQERERIRDEENEKLRKNAALDLHDEFGNGLTRISMLVELTRMKVSDVNPEASKLLDIISDNSTRLYNGTKDYIWSINSSSDNLYEVIIRIKDFGDELFYGRGIHFNVSGLEEDLKNMKQVPGTGRNVAMIFKEALSNVMKHSDATEVTLQVTKDENLVSLKLKDNGRGFNTGTNGSGFGLGNMKQRASRIKGQFSVQSEKGEGSEITLTLKEYK